MKNQCIYHIYFRYSDIQQCIIWVCYIYIYIYYIIYIIYIWGYHTAIRYTSATFSHLDSHVVDLRQGRRHLCSCSAQSLGLDWYIWQCNGKDDRNIVFWCQGVSNDGGFWDINISNYVITIFRICIQNQQNAIWVGVAQSWWGKDTFKPLGLGCPILRHSQLVDSGRMASHLSQRWSLVGTLQATILLFFSRQIPSGYVKIAIENGHL